MASPAPLHIVSGKGGTGKTTVALALAAALSSRGARVLVCEVEGRQGLAEVVGRPPLPIGKESPLFTSGRGQVFGLAVGAREALTDYLATFPGLGLAGVVLDKSGLTDFATSIAPGLRDVLLFGKVYQAARAKAKGAAGAFDAVVLDAPPTGRIAGFLGASKSLIELAPGSPVAGQAARLVELLAEPSTVVHLVTLLRELPVNETIEALAELSDVGVRSGGVVCNQVHHPVRLAALPDELRDPRTGADLPGLLAELLAAMARTRGEDHQRRLLTEAAGAPFAELPTLAETIEVPQIRQLAEHFGAARSPRPSPARRANPGRADPVALDLDGVLLDPRTRVILCCGTGGVGKTSLSAALAVRAADSGRRVVALTIDPAKRLADALGLDELSHEPRAIAGITGNGSLDAMMLDTKHAFDAAILRMTSPDRAAQIIENPFYRTLSESFAGTTEYLAMERLADLLESDRHWDLIVVDTPPSRSALDFLDAPKRLTALLDGRLLALLTPPARGPLRALGVGANLIASGVARLIGGTALADLGAFVSAFESVLGGFARRSEATRATLATEAAAFFVIATPQRPALREAHFFANRLASEHMPLRGLIVNRCTEALSKLDQDQTKRLASELPSDSVRSAAAAEHLRLLAARHLERRLIAAELPTNLSAPLGLLGQLGGELADLGSLRLAAALLAAQHTAPGFDVGALPQ